MSELRHEDIASHPVTSPTPLAALIAGDIPGTPVMLGIARAVVAAIDCQPGVRVEPVDVDLSVAGGLRHGLHACQRGAIVAGRREQAASE